MTRAARADRLPPTADPRCGTDAGYSAHRTRGESPCVGCQAASRKRSREKNRRQRATPEGREASRAAVQRQRATPAGREAHRAEMRRRRATPEGGAYARLKSRERRAARLSAPHEPYDSREVFESSGWVCGICGAPIDPALSWPHPGSASLDHVVPLSRGGGDVLSNVQPAHLRCNVSKGARDAALTTYLEDPS